MAAMALLSSSEIMALDLETAFERNFRFNSAQTICYNMTADGTNFYLAGFEQTSGNRGYITAYDKKGVKLWETSISASTILRKVYVAGDYVYGLGYATTNGTDGVVVKLDKATGAPSATWPSTGKGIGVRHYGNSMGNSFNCGLVLNGEFIAAGYQSTAANSTDGVVVRYDAAGNLSPGWPDTGNGVGVRTLSSGVTGTDMINDIGIENGRLTMCGRLAKTTTSSKGFVWKLLAATGVNYASWADTGAGVGVRTFMDSGMEIGVAYDLALHGTTTGVAGAVGSDAVLVQLNGSGNTFFTYTQGGSGGQAFTEVIPKNGGGYFAVGPDDGQSMICNVQGNGTGAPGWESTPVNGKKNYPLVLNGPCRVVRDAANQPYFAAYSDSATTQADVSLFTVGIDNVVSEVGKIATNESDQFDSMTMDAEGSVAINCSTYNSPTSTSLAKFGVARSVNPILYSVDLGEEFNGGLDTLLSSDNNSLEIFNDPVNLGATVRFVMVIAPESIDPNKLIFRFETGVGRPGLAMQMSVFDDDASQWHLRIGVTATVNDSTLKNTISINPTRYIDNARNVWMRLNWAPINDEDPSVDGWTHRVDQVVLTAVQ